MVHVLENFVVLFH